MAANNWELKIGRRKIDRGERAKFNRFFSPALGTNTIVNRGADVPTTISQIKEIVGDTLAQTKAIASFLAQGTNDVRLIASRIHKLLWDCFDYDEREVRSQEELLREPIRIWADEIGDCDCFTILISSILTNLRIPHTLRVAKYESENQYGFKEVGEWQHIYVIIPTQFKYITIDGVLSQFDKEYPFYAAQDYTMATYRLGNLPTDTSADQETKTFQALLKMVEDNPEDAINYGYSNVDNFKKMLHFAIDNWDKDKVTVLETLAQEEANMNTLNGVGYLGSIFDESDAGIAEELSYLRGLGAILKKKNAPAVIKKTAPAVIKKAAPALVKTAAPAKPAQAAGKGKAVLPADQKAYEAAIAKAKAANAPQATIKVQPQKKNLFQKIKDKVTQGDGKFSISDAAHLFTKVPLAPARLVVIMAIKVNALNLKDNLKDPAKYIKFEKAWVNWGGEKKALSEAINGKGSVSGVLGSLGFVGVDDAAIAGAGIAPAAAFLFKVMAEIPGLFAKKQEPVSGFGASPGVKTFFEKINLQDIVEVLKSIFKKKDKPAEDKNKAAGNDVKARGGEQGDFGQEGDIKNIDEPKGDGEGDEQGGGDPGSSLRKTTYIDKDSDGYDDDTKYKYTDANNDGIDDNTGITIIKGKKNFFVENPMITGGLVLATGLLGYGIWRFFIKKNKTDEKPKPLSGAPKKTKKDKNTPKRLPIMA